MLDWVVQTVGGLFLLGSLQGPHLGGGPHLRGEARLGPHSC